METCYLCKTESVTKLLDLGMQPICNRYLTSSKDEEYKHPMMMGQCNNCGLVQLINPVPVNELIPRYDWITYNEAEGHLDKLAKIISKLPGITKKSKICGVSFKDDSTLSRMNRLGFKHTWRIDLEKDLDVKDKRAGIETIQDKLIPEMANKITEKYGRADILIVRHVLEHAYDMHKFMESLKKLIVPGGYIVVEVPDCTTSLETHNYTMLWEEHITYFTPETFRHCFAFYNYSLLHLECYPYPFENALVGITRLENKTQPFLPSPQKNILKEKNRAIDFSKGLTEQRDKLKNLLSKDQVKTALFGAGHLSCTFINLLDLDKYIEFIVDDNPNKKGLFMPGSKIHIKGSDALFEKDIKLCLLSLGPESEDKVIQNNQSFLKNGGIFSSITPASKHALDLNILREC